MMTTFVESKSSTSHGCEEEDDQLCIYVYTCICDEGKEKREQTIRLVCLFASFFLFGSSRVVEDEGPA